MNLQTYPPSDRLLHKAHENLRVLLEARIVQWEPKNTPGETGFLLPGTPCMPEKTRLDCILPGTPCTLYNFSDNNPKEKILIQETLYNIPGLVYSVHCTGSSVHSVQGLVYSVYRVHSTHGPLCFA